jgi:hypothetical protein
MKVKGTFLLSLFFAAHLAITAQVVNNLVVFCNEAEPFTLILNGLKENQTPETNVRVTGLDLKIYQVKIIFQNRKLKDVNTTLTFYRTGKECVFALNKKGSKKHTMDYVSEKEMDGFLNQPTANPEGLNNINTQTTTTPGSINNTVVSPFQTTLTTIASQPTEADKLNTALALLQKNTFTAIQIKEVLALFSQEQTKLTFAKQACTQLKDPASCTEIISSVVTEPVRQELKKFIDGTK